FRGRRGRTRAGGGRRRRGGQSGGRTLSGGPGGAGGGGGLCGGGGGGAGRGSVPLPLLHGRFLRDRRRGDRRLHDGRRRSVCQRRGFGILGRRRLRFGGGVGGGL